MTSVENCTSPSYSYIRHFIGFVFLCKLLLQCLSSLISIHSFSRSGTDLISLLVLFLLLGWPLSNLNQKA